MSKKVIPADSTTEEKIKEAGRKVFIRKGYAGTTTREIADEAGLTHALVNYYFRSKDKLFDIVTQEQVAAFFGKIYPIVNNEDTNLDEKVKGLINYYTEILIEEPGMVFFISSEMQNRPERIAKNMEDNQGLAKAVIARQLHEARPDIHPMQLMMCILGMIIFPYISRGVFQRSMGISENDIIKMLKERAEFLPALIKAMLSN
ncbi:MAG: TetR/AcrR family transcriptional regulator [Mucilaginibacter sp.]|uniref:TetR/AcrR family transcriptional regulator n=1 Tax=Mucilaginibacter sp. TaxID=1882438 RepID=UPI0031AC0CA1